MSLDRELRRRPSLPEPISTFASTTIPSVSMASPKPSSMTPTKTSISSPSPSMLMISPMKPPAQGNKRRSTSQTKGDEDGHQTNKRRRHNKNHPHITNGTSSTKEDMFENYQPWVIQTYGDSAKTKTITLRKYARVLRTLRGEESNSVENSKFRFWVKAKGFRIGQPPGYVPKPADGIVGTQTLSDDKEGGNQDPPLYVPTTTAKNKIVSQQ
ncbi:hypothetical protein L9F63_013437, partial [Diploptera punctata]